MWVSRCRKSGAAEQLIRKESGEASANPVIQEVVPVSIVPDSISTEPAFSAPALQESDTMHFDNSHKIEIVANGITIRICNDASSSVISRVFRHLKEIGC